MFPRSAAATAALLTLLVASGRARAAEEAEKPLQDNSFLVEEAYNQEPGVIQHIALFQRQLRGGSDWVLAVTEEWPAWGQTHQASVTAEYARADGERGFGDVLLNYRWQAVGSGDAPLAISPRLSAVLPAGAGARGLGSGGWGAQALLPVSVELRRLIVLHGNAGATWIPSASRPEGRGDAWAFHAAQGVVWLLHRRLNPLVEVLYERDEVTLDRGGTAREETLLVSPGVRGGVDVGKLQIVGGVAAPFGVGPSGGERRILFYLSFEHPAWGGGA